MQRKDMCYMCMLLNPVHTLATVVFIIPDNVSALLLLFRDLAKGLQSLKFKIFNSTHISL